MAEVAHRRSTDKSTDDLKIHSSTHMNKNGRKITSPGWILFFLGNFTPLFPKSLEVTNSYTYIHTSLLFCAVIIAESIRILDGSFST